MGRRYKNRSDSTHYHDWVEKAEDDLLAAGLLITDNELYAPCAFHCQQCAEKILKAYILFSKKQLLDGHNLSWLCRQAQTVDPSFEQWLDECVALNHYYIESRYPSDFSPAPTQAEIASALRMATELFNYVCDQMGL